MSAPRCPGCGLIFIDSKKREYHQSQCTGKPRVEYLHKLAVKQRLAKAKKK